MRTNDDVSERQEAVIRRLQDENERLKESLFEESTALGLANTGWANAESQLQETRALLETRTAALEKISRYHFDSYERDESYACGAGCDMGESGSKIDERGHDENCVFAIATKALLPSAATPLLDAVRG